MLTAGMLLGGLGLFLLAVNMITDGLRAAAGGALRDILARYTSTPLRGVLSGMLVTGVVQSSGAVTVATIGFANAGLLTLPQSLGVVYGANVGTTMTGWLVAAVGFNLKLEALALPLVGLGMLARLLGGGRRIGALGEAVAGFGLFFIGIDVLREAFAGITAAVDVSAFSPAGAAGLAGYVGLGFLMTVLTHSSSAAIALTLTAVSGGTVAMEPAAAMVIGANVGTTSAAGLAAIGATANARRVAAAHVIFNLATGVVALLLLPLMLWLLGVAGRALAPDATPVALLALFHTVFNVLGVLLMWPFTPRLAAFLSRRFVTRAESLARPLHLDRTVLVAPDLAVEALKLELLRALALAREAALTALAASPPPAAGHREQMAGLHGLLDAVESFVAQLETERMGDAPAAELPVLLRVSNYLEDTANIAAALEARRDDLRAVQQEPTREAVAGFLAELAQQLGRCRPAAVESNGEALDQGLVALEQRWHSLKTRLLEAASRRAVPIGTVHGALDALRAGLRMAEQLTKATRRLQALNVSAAPPS